jgi:sulfonate transport system ATP-binding protein
MRPGVTVEAAGIHRQFGAHVVLNDLNLSAAPGEFVAIVGRSGGGKSTLLRLFAGVDRPDRGAIRVGGAPLNGLCSSARMMFQDGRLLPWLRVGENVGIGLSNPDRGRIREMLSAVGQVERIDDWPAKLSGGQKQRVALARALIARPGLLLLDEPLGSLDALTRLEMQRLIESLWQQSSATGMLVTHDVDEAVALADRVVLLHEGRAAGEWAVNLARPRDRANPAFSALAQTILGCVLYGMPNAGADRELQADGGRCEATEESSQYPSANRNYLEIGPPTGSARTA